MDLESPQHRRLRRGGTLTRPTTDDWVLTFTLRHTRTRKIITRTLGVNGWASEDEAKRIATLTVFPPRAMAEGRVHAELIDIRCCKMHQYLQGVHGLTDSTKL